MIHMSGSTCQSILPTSLASSTPVVSTSDASDPGTASSSGRNDVGRFSISKKSWGSNHQRARDRARFIVPRHQAVFGRLHFGARVAWCCFNVCRTIFLIAT
jgi:hypothetical protein